MWEPSVTSETLPRICDKATTAAARPPRLALAPARGAGHAGRMTDIESCATRPSPPTRPAATPRAWCWTRADLSDAAMLAVAAEVGYSETAFLTEDRARALPGALLQPAGRGAVLRARHRGDRRGARRPARAGHVRLRHQRRRGAGDRRRRAAPATLTSVAPAVADLAEADLPALLAALRLAARPTSTRPCRPGSRTPAPVTRSSRPRAGSGSPTSTTTCPPEGAHGGAAAGPRSSSCGARPRTASTCATRSRSAASTRTRPPGAAAAAFGGYLRDLGLVPGRRGRPAGAGRRPGPARPAHRHADARRGRRTGQRHGGADRR